MHRIFAGQSEQLIVVTDAAGVVQQVPDRDGITVVRYLGQIGPDIVIEGKLPLTLRQQDRRRREHLGRRSDEEDGRGRYRHAVFQARHAVAALVDQLPIADQAKRAPG